MGCAYCTDRAQTLPKSEIEDELIRQAANQERMPQNEDESTFDDSKIELRLIYRNFKPFQFEYSYLNKHETQDCS